MKMSGLGSPGEATRRASLPEPPAHLRRWPSQTSGCDKPATDGIARELPREASWANAGVVIEFGGASYTTIEFRAGSVCLNSRLAAAKWISAMLCCNRDWLQRGEVGLIRRPPIKAGMGPSGIVKAVDISADGGPCLRDTGVGS